MAFQIKDFASITASMLNWFRSAQNKITDFNVGSVARTLVEAPAAEIDELYQQMFIGLKEAIPVSVYNSFSFDALEPEPASGLVRVTVSSSTTQTIISAGTVMKYDGGAVGYEVLNDTIIPAGNTFIDVLVSAQTPGTAGNISAGKSFELTPSPTNFVSATNLSPFINGSSEETEDARKLRFNAYIASLNRGTLAALDYGLKLAAIEDANGNVIERVASTSIVEPYKVNSSNPTAWVQCYIHNGVGSTSSNLVDRAVEVIYGYYNSDGVAVPGWKAAGVKVDIYSATEQAVNVTGVLTAATGYIKADLITQAQEVVFTYLQDLPIGETAIRAEIVKLVKSIDGVYNFVLSAPASDVAAAKNIKLMPGTIALS